MEARETTLCDAPSNIKSLYAPSKADTIPFQNVLLAMSIYYQGSQYSIFTLFPPLEQNDEEERGFYFFEKLSSVSCSLHTVVV